MFGGDEEDFGKSESGEIRECGFVFWVVDLVENEHDRWSGLAEFLGDRLVDRSESVVGVDHEQDEVGCLHRDVCLDGDLRVEAILDVAADATGIDDRARVGGCFGGGADAVAGHAGLVVHDGDFATCEAVEERGFPDIRAADDGDSGHGLGMKRRKPAERKVLRRLV